MPSPMDSTTPLHTRICIKNLPPSYSNHNLREFLQKQKPDLVLTDCRILHQNGKSRRMAFAGLAKSDQAAWCVQNLNRSYCQTSRLVVEYAKPPVLRESTATTAEIDKLAKQKTPDDRAPTNQQTNKETSSSMRITTKSTGTKFWANDDAILSSRETIANSASRVANSEASCDPAKDSDATASVSSSDSNDDADPLQNQDLDFLRSKQVAVNDLTDLPTNDTNVRHDGQGTESLSSSGSSVSSNSSSSPSKSSVNISDKDRKANTEKELGDDVKHSSACVEATDDAIDPNRLFLRNLPFSASENDVRDHFAPFGVICECYMPVDDQKRPKGYCFLAFETAAAAESARNGLDGTDFQGRLLHIIPARRVQDSNGLDDARLSYKDKQEKSRQQKANDSQGWSASFVRGDAVVDNLAARLGLRKGDVLNVKDQLSSGDAAVRLALAETAVIEENRQYFAENGIDMEALVSYGTDKVAVRSDTRLLVKNLPFDTTKEELSKTFSAAGVAPMQILLPPSKTVAVVEYTHASDAKRAFKRLAYRRFKCVPIYLEWAPLAAQTSAIEAVEKKLDEGETGEVVVSGPVPTIYVKNLNFSTTEDDLLNLFADKIKDVNAVRIPQKVAPLKGKHGTENSGELKSTSMGYGFVEFGKASSVKLSLELLQGSFLDGHQLELKPSNNVNQTATVSDPVERDHAKLIIRNVPFQATRKEILQLFGSFGQLKKVRLPKKFDGTHRGFAFVEFLTRKEAAAAMKALAQTHIYGRHLVLEWASTDEETGNLTKLRSRAQDDIPNSKRTRLE